MIAPVFVRFSAVESRNSVFPARTTRELHERSLPAQLRLGMHRRLRSENRDKSATTHSIAKRCEQKAPVLRIGCGHRFE